MTKSEILEIQVPLNAIPNAMSNPDTELSVFFAPESPEKIPYRILKKSVDARKKHAIKILYRVEIHPTPIAPITDYPIKKAKELHPIIVGAGPAGLLAAWQLARSGACPIIIERGQPVEQRKLDIREFHHTHTLNTESHYLFGEGGAGTYSDGKLYTRIKDPRCDLILQLFAAHGAPEEIQWLQRPHIGSDKLPAMIANLRNEIIAMGGTFKWETRCESLIFEGNKCKGVVLSTGEKLEAPAVILGIGHSARSLILHLVENHVAHAVKNIQIGCRVEHPQTFVNQNTYGNPIVPQHLPIPEYHWVSRPEINSVLSATSFCMCPGGEIIPATDRNGILCTNGMSPYKRNGAFANAAIIATMPNAPASAEDAFRFIEQIERRAYALGGGNFCAPAQTIKGFLKADPTLGKNTESSYDLGIVPADVSQLLPRPIFNALNYAFPYFDRIAPGFIAQGKVVGVETRISSPVRFLRNPETLESESHAGLYITGEGAGCAGGIISAAVDGLRIAEAYLEHC